MLTLNWLGRHLKMLFGLVISYSDVGMSMDVFGLLF